MKVCVFGLWHLGSVTVAALASRGVAVVGLDPDPEVTAGLSQGRPPLYEPGLADLVQTGLGSGTLEFTTDREAALKGAAVVWVAFDTPVDDNDVADTDYVMNQVVGLYPWLEDQTVVLVSSQMPVGSAAELARRFQAEAKGRTVHFAVSPENLRLGKALDVFLNPDRIVVGIRDAAARDLLAPMLAAVTDRVVWMGVESAEMTKHAINAFLATSIVFANEIASVCERVGADASEVAHGLKSEARIGPGAYVKPGGPFAGGTLARDVQFLTQIGDRDGLDLPALRSIRPSNDSQKQWSRRAVERLLPDLAGRAVAIIGLTYKAGTDTLRRSAAVELAESLAGEGVAVRAFDPAVKVLPESLSGIIDLKADPVEAASGSDAVILSYDSAEFQALDWNAIIGGLHTPVLIDAGGGMAKWAGAQDRISYACVGLTLEKDAMQ